MSKSVIALILILIVVGLGLGLFFYYQKGNTPETPAPVQTPQSTPSPSESQPQTQTQTQIQTPPLFPTTPSKNPPSQTRENPLVTYTDAGYSPKTLTIKKGSTVTFKNQSSNPMWTASGNHPVHNIYPIGGGCIASLFDACQGIPQGGEWQFKFDITGTWGYHNHLSPNHTGAVTIEL